MLLRKFERQNTLNSMFDDAFFGISHNTSFDIIESDDLYKINLLMAGYSKDNFNLEVNGDELVITGERTKPSDIKYNYINSFYGKITKKFTLPNNVNINKIDAEYVDGVLMVKIPKDSEVLNRKKITVK